MTTYNCVCLKCKKEYISEDETCQDGEDFCPACREEKNSIAKKVDAQITLKRENRTPARESNVYQEIRKKPKGSISYMNI